MSTQFDAGTKRENFLWSGGDLYVERIKGGDGVKVWTSGLVCSGAYKKLVMFGMD